MPEAYVTLATNDRYALGALVLAHSLRAVNTTKDLAILISPSVAEPIKSQLTAVFNSVVVVDVLDSRDSAHLALLKRPELGVTFTKLHCWSLTQYSKGVFLDADMLAVQNPDELFEQPELSASCDVGWPDCFNSGMFVFSPSQDTYTRLLQHAENVGSFDGGDQGLLNTFFSNWNRLSFVYNMVASATYTYLPAFKQYGKGVKLVHFLGATKPWHMALDSQSGSVVTSSQQKHLSSHLDLWWQIYITSVRSSLPQEHSVETTTNKDSHPHPHHPPPPSLTQPIDSPATHSETQVIPSHNILVSTQNVQDQTQESHVTLHDGRDSLDLSCPSLENVCIVDINSSGSIVSTKVSVNDVHSDICHEKSSDLSQNLVYVVPDPIDRASDIVPDPVDRSSDTVPIPVVRSSDLVPDCVDRTSDQVPDPIDRASDLAGKLLEYVCKSDFGSDRILNSPVASHSSVACSEIIADNNSSICELVEHPISSITTSNPDSKPTRTPRRATSMSMPTASTSASAHRRSVPGSLHKMFEGEAKFSPVLADHLTGLSISESAAEENRKRWEQGHPDYMGADSFENIQKYLDSKVNQ